MGIARSEVILSRSFFYWNLRFRPQESDAGDQPEASEAHRRQGGAEAGEGAPASPLSEGTQQSQPPKCNEHVFSFAKFPGHLLCLVTVACQDATAL